MWKYHIHRSKGRKVKVVIKSESVPVPSAEDFLLMYSLENEICTHPVGSTREKKYFLSELGRIKIYLGKKPSNSLSYTCNIKVIHSLFFSIFILLRARSSLQRQLILINILKRKYKWSSHSLVIFFCKLVACQSKMRQEFPFPKRRDHK